MINLGKGDLVSSFRKQKIQCEDLRGKKISGACDSVTILPWSKYFIYAQDYIAEINIIYQVKKSKMF